MSWVGWRVGGEGDGGSSNFIPASTSEAAARVGGGLSENIGILQDLN